LLGPGGDKGSAGQVLVGGEGRGAREEGEGWGGREGGEVEEHARGAYFCNGNSFLIRLMDCPGLCILSMDSEYLMCAWH
jgi:hypothetical protein